MTTVMDTGRGVGEGIAPASLFNEFTIKFPADSGAAPFEGPLDLLLHLVRKHELDIFDIPIHFITSEYLKYLQVMESLDVTVSSEFLVMAATLVHIKSQMLLPSQYLRPAETDRDYRKSLSPEDPRFQLVQALLSKQVIEMVATELGVRDQWARAMYTPEFARQPETEEQPYDFSDLTFNHLLTAFQRALSREKPAPMTVLAPRLSVGDVLREIRHLHRQGVLTFSFAELVRPEPRAYRIVAVFLALLELARQGKVSLTQAEPGGDIAALWEESLVA